MEQQALLSKLAFGTDNPEWSTVGWPSLLGGRRSFHASLVIENDKGGKMLVVMGGRVNDSISKSVLLMDLTKEEKEWVEGPSLFESKRQLAAEKCNGGVYVFGGFNSSSLATIERIDEEDIWNFNKNQSAIRWTTMTCRLSTARWGCAAAAVLDRYIVVIGGYYDRQLSSVEIVDTVQHTIVSGPEMTVPRYGTSIGVIGNRILAVGGHSGSNNWNSVEFLEFNDDIGDNQNNINSVFGAASWKIESGLTLSDARRQHALVQLDSCLIVAGGYYQTGAVSSVEVLDTERRVVWSLPKMTVACQGCSMVALPDSVAVIGGSSSDSIESLPLLSRKQQLMNKYSCRKELNEEIHRLSAIVKRANDVETANIGDLEEAAQAEISIRILESLCTTDKFLTGEELQSKIEKLQVEYNNAKSVDSKIPILKKIKEYQEMLGKNKIFATEYGRRNGHSTKNASVHDAFYTKLVGTTYVNIMFQLQELVSFVVDVHKMRVFYTFVNKLFRSNKISDKERQYFIVGALQTVAKNKATMPQGERFVWEMILQKCREDGIGNLDEVIQDHSKSEDSDMHVLPSDICRHLCAVEFRIGRLLPVSKNQFGNNEEDSNDQSGNNEEDDDQRIMTHVKSLGWSLNQLYSAHCHKSDQEIAAAAICSLLNACRLCSNVITEMEQGGPTTRAFSQIVDFGDVEHIASIVEQTGSCSSSRAWEEGIRIVETAVSMTTGDQAGSTVLVAIMGNLAIGLKKLVSSGSNEEASILSLAVASKLTQTMERSDNPNASVSSPLLKQQDNSKQTMERSDNSKSTSEYAKPVRDSATSTYRPILTKAVPNLGEKEHQQTAMKQLASSSMELVLLPQWDYRLHRLESKIGSKIGSAQRIEFLEQTLGLPAKDGMTYGERLSRLEELFD